MSSGCKLIGARLQEGIDRMGMTEEVKVIVTGCMGLCSYGPMIMIYPEGILYVKLTPEDVDRIVEGHLYRGEYVEDLFYEDPMTKERIGQVNHIPFFRKQVKIALRNVGKIDPLQIEEYIAFDGYFALAKALTEMTPQQVVEEMKKSGLRGRGGAGFPTGLKWEFTAKAKGHPKYVACNADEGDPGAFMDRSIIEGDPHTLIEGMTIAGYAIGASQGFVYIRAEYPMAVEHLELALQQARAYGLLGKDIMGSGFDFDIEVRVGAGAFVCGEETGLIASLEGKRGEPRPKPPFPSNEGLWQKPTVINNVETYANVPEIIQKGADWFRKIGTDKSPGTKVFALAGNVANTGLVEIPMGTPLGDIVYDIGGGIIDDKPFKAAQTGGPSGGCIPREYLNVSVDYESLAELGTIMGSGGLIIMDDDTCMVDIAKFFLDFVQEESCGKCTPCRIGTKRMLEILDRITKGQGREGDIETLERLGQEIMDTALCGLGQSAPNPVLSTIRYFRDEYEAHIRHGKCPASVCASLFDAPCRNACPAGVDVSRYIEMIQRGQYARAVDVIRERNPLPAVCGRVCDHPCESKCRRSQIDDPLAIRALKRFAADYELEHWDELYFNREIAPVVKRDKPVAVVGGGPAGITAAYYLSQWGYPVTLFEASPVLGGMLALTIPEYRLPKKVLYNEIDRLMEGVNVITNFRIGKDMTLKELQQQFQAIFMAVGTHKAATMGIEGEDLIGVTNALEFLKKVNLHMPVEVGKRVVVVGGGNSAVDAARVALRMGAGEVRILYRRTRQEMPAIELEIQDAIDEGIKLHTLTSPLRIIGDEYGRVLGMECCRMDLGNFDSSGRRRPYFREGSRFRIDVDTVIMAIGMEGDWEDLQAEIPEIFHRGKVARQRDESLMTPIPGIFAGGDCARGADTVIWAIADGRQAALSIDRYLGGNREEEEEKISYPRRYFAPVVESRLERVEIPVLPVKERKYSNVEVELCLSAEECRKEALRCLRCDVRD